METTTERELLNESRSLLIDILTEMTSSVIQELREDGFKVELPEYNPYGSPYNG